MVGTHHPTSWTAPFSQVGHAATDVEQFFEQVADSSGRPSSSRKPFKFSRKSLRIDLYQLNLGYKYQNSKVKVS